MQGFITKVGEVGILQQGIPVSERSANRLLLMIITTITTATVTSTAAIATVDCRARVGWSTES